MEFVHQSVLLHECIEALNIKPDGIYLDGTLGGAGHSYQIASRLNENGLLIGIDRDTVALTAAGERLAPLNKPIRLVHENFQNLDSVLEELNIRQPTLSHHMKILCDAGLVTGRKEGKWMHYSICCGGAKDITQMLQELLTASDTPDDCCKET